MAPLKVLICGGGCAGPSLAFWLSRLGHQVVIVERFPVLRASGAQIDIRGQGVEAIKRMGIRDTILSKVVDEDGAAFIDQQGNRKAVIMANKTGHGAQSFTSEYEIMRGDLVRILYDETKDKAEYRFGLTVERFEQDDERVVVFFSDGSSESFDILVGADGQGSRIRRAMQPPGTPDPLRRIGATVAYFFVPRTKADGNIAEMCHVPGGRVIARRSHSPTETQVYFTMRTDKDMSFVTHAPVEQQKEFYASAFRDSEWQTDRFLDGMKKADNFYCHEIIQVRTDRWFKGRVVLLGDAGYCASPFSGMGTSLAFVGSYILAGELARHPDDIQLAFQNYHDTMRPFVEQTQQIRTSLVRLFLPQSRWAIRAWHFIFWLITVLRIPELLYKFGSDDKGDWRLPIYPELKV